MPRLPHRRTKAIIVANGDGMRYSRFIHCLTNWETLRMRINCKSDCSLNRLIGGWFGLKRIIGPWLVAFVLRHFLGATYDTPEPTPKVKPHASKAGPLEPCQPPAQR